MVGEFILVRGFRRGMVAWSSALGCTSWQQKHVVEKPSAFIPSTN